MKEKMGQIIKKNSKPFVIPRNMDNSLRPTVAPSGSRVVESLGQKEKERLQCLNYGVIIMLGNVQLRER